MSERAGGAEIRYNVRMKVYRGFVRTALALALASGCATIRDARDVQRALAPKGDDCAAATSADAVDFRGASLERLVDFAMTNRPSVAAKALAVRDARLALKALAADAPVLGGSPLTAPHLSLSAGHSESGDGTHIGDGGWRTRGGATAALSLDLLVYDFGRYAAKARSQAEQVVAAELSLAEEVFGVFRDVSESYFDFYEKRALLSVAATNELQFAEHLARAEERRKAGEANRLDVLKARLDLAKARQSVVAASNLVETTGATLMQSLGVDASRGTWATAFGTDATGFDSVRRAFAATDDGVDSAFALARTNAPAMRVARARLRAASHSVEAAVADLYPSITASASLSWTDPLWAFRWGFSAAQSVFEGFRKTTAVDRAVVALESAAADVDEAEQVLSVSVETAVASRDNSREAVASAVASVRSAAENLETVREQFAVGSASRVELSEAIADDSQARGDCITAFYDGQRAEAALFALTGRVPVFAEEIVRQRPESPRR